MDNSEERKKHRDEINAYFKPSAETLRKVEALFGKPLIVVQVKPADRQQQEDSTESDHQKDESSTKE